VVIFFVCVNDFVTC